LNPQSNQIRLCKKSYDKFLAGDEKIEEKLCRLVPKLSSGFMVAVGLSANGVRKLIFCVGTMNSFSYKQTLDYFKEDVERLNSDLLFQHDNARCHTSNKSMQHIGDIFKENKLEFLPPNSPDLSPIETLWAIVQNKLQEKTYTTMEQQKEELVKIWNRIPASLCEKLCDSFDKKILQIAKTGKRYNSMRDKQKNTGKKENLNWNEIWNDYDGIERIVYNDEVLKEHQKKAVKLLTKQFLFERKVYNKEVLPKYKEKNIKELKKTLSFPQLNKHIAEGERLDKEYGERQMVLLERRDNVKNMSLEEYYSSLSSELRIKLINERVANSFDDFNTQAETEENDEESDPHQESDDSGSHSDVENSYSGMIVDDSE